MKIPRRSGSPKNLKDLRDFRKDPGSLGAPETRAHRQSLRPEWRGIPGLVEPPHHPAKTPKMSGDIGSAETLRLFAWWQAVPEADFFMGDWRAGDRG